MKAEMTVTGVEQLKVELRHMADTVLDRARKTMRRNADIIEKEAKLNAPYDTGALEASIHQELSYGDRGRLQIDVVAGGVVDGVDVDAYATMVHENYDDNRPGPGTIVKRALDPTRYIGRKYLERAFLAQRDKLMRDMIDNVNEVTGSDS